MRSACVRPPRILAPAVEGAWWLQRPLVNMSARRRSGESTEPLPSRPISAVVTPTTRGHPARARAGSARNDLCGQRQRSAARSRDSARVGKRSRQRRPDAAAIVEAATGRHLGRASPARADDPPPTTAAPGRRHRRRGRPAPRRWRQLDGHRRGSWHQPSGRSSEVQQSRLTRLRQRQLSRLHHWCRCVYV